MGVVLEGLRIAGRPRRALPTLARVLILLPPSEGKSAPRRGKPLSLASSIDIPASSISPRLSTKSRQSVASRKRRLLMLLPIET